MSELRYPHGVAALSLSELPLAIQEAYQASLQQPYEVQDLMPFGASVKIEAVSVADSRAGVLYTTRDGGQSFAVERIRKTVYFRGDPSLDEAIEVHRVVRIVPAGASKGRELGDSAAL